MSDLRLYLADMAAWPSRDTHREWLRRNDRFRRDILERLDSSGPLLSRDIPDTSVVAWPSSGWTNDRNVTQMLEFLVLHGEVAIAGRRGRQRVWDLADRCTRPRRPSCRSRRRAESATNGAYGRWGSRARRRPPSPSSPWMWATPGEEATVEGVPGTWRVDPEALGEPFEGRTALLSPFDPLIHDRARALALFAFEHVLEMYKPKADRRWGYFALPVLHHDRLVGKVDATADRTNSTLYVHAIHEDVRFTRAISTAVDAEVEALASWLGLGSVDGEDRRAGPSRA